MAREKRTLHEDLPPAEADFPGCRKRSDAGRIPQAAADGGERGEREASVSPAGDRRNRNADRRTELPDRGSAQKKEDRDLIIIYQLFFSNKQKFLKHNNESDN